MRVFFCRRRRRSGVGSDSAANVYYSQPIVNVGWSSSPDKIQAIIVQKWAALNGLDLLEEYQTNPANVQSEGSNHAKLFVYALPLPIVSAPGLTISGNFANGYWQMIAA